MDSSNYHCKYDVLKICRSCLIESQEMRSLFSSEEISGRFLPVSEMLMACAAVQVRTGDGLPMMLCLQCIHQLNNAYKFKQQCENADYNLRQKLLCNSELYIKSSENDGLNKLEITNLKPGVREATYELHYQNNKSLEEKNEVSCYRNISSDIQVSDEYEKNATNFDEESIVERRTCNNREKPKLNVYSSTIVFKKDREKSKSNMKQCPHCLKTFRKTANLTLHVKTHTGEKSHCCNICQKRFIQASSLTRHLRIHTGDRPFACNLCSMRFSTSDGLRRHETSHTQVRMKKYKCSVCPKVFTSSSGLNYHKHIHTGTKNYFCDICQKGFIGHANLLVHKRRHNREFTHLCSECGKKFLTLGELSRHSRKHSNEKPFQCDICKKCFTTNVSLSQHKMRHEGQKPFLCCIQACSKRFTTRSLAKHLQKHPHLTEAAVDVVCSSIRTS
ncbi:uncharacterized protein CBL_06579 [Carabus blaptoides fortunei]